MSVVWGVRIYERDETDDIDICTSQSTDSDGNVSFSGALKSSCGSGEYTTSQVSGGQFHD